MDAGEVTFTDLDGRFGTTSAAFNAADGTYTIENVKVMPGGSNYQFAANHSLYLSNQAIFRLEPGQAYGNVNTQLRGGDANNNGAIELDDLACIGGAFGGAPSSCGATGSSDINADSVVNIFDVVLHGSNYLLTAPQGW